MTLQIARARGAALGWCVAVVAAGATLASAPLAHGADVVRNIAYPSSISADGSRLLDMYTPASHSFPGQYTIILIHGGSYSAGDKADFATVAHPLADMGYGVVSMNYTLAAPGAPSFPLPVVEALNVVRWVRTEGLQHGLPDRVILAGHSAGATIAMTAAMAAQSPQSSNFASLPPAERRGFVIDGAISISGRCDIYWNAVVGNAGSVVNYLGMSVGAPDWQTVYSNATAVTYVNACSPPTVIIHGTNDLLIPYQNSQRFSNALTLTGVPAQLTLVNGGGHDISLIGLTPTDQANWIAQGVQWILASTQPVCGRLPAGPLFGACCSETGTCTVTFEPECLTGLWRSAMYCSPAPCPVAGRCCINLECTTLTQAACAGVWLGPGGVCDQIACQSQHDIGACCRGSTCEVVPGWSCTGPFSSFLGASTACNLPGQYAAPCRMADFNRSQDVTVQDVFDFLTAWFAGDLTADMYSNGANIPGVQSIFTFLSAWFEG